MYKSVIVALDGSGQAAKAVAQAVDIAERFGARLTLLRVLQSEKDLEDAGPLPDSQRAEISQDVLGVRDYASQRSQAEGYLASIKRSIKADELDVEIRLTEGEPAAQILSEAAGHPESLIVITPFGKSASLTPTKGGVFGRVADQVLKQSNTPVLVVKN
jgi:nucleotide-binding universal stress UspA family protein